MSEPTWIDSNFGDLPALREGSGAPGAEPRRLGDFELVREIGRGGMGIVYEAQQTSLKRRVALKVLPSTFGLNQQAIERFEREAHAAAKLHHGHIVPIYAIGEQDGCHFYAMELVEGQSLDRLLSAVVEGRTNHFLAETVGPTQTTGGEVPVRSSKDDIVTSLPESVAGGRKWFNTVARLAAEVAEALEHAHSRGVVHRDIKPGNLLLTTDGRPILTDFGLARLMEESSLTLSGSFLGTPAYMSPEQVAAGRMKLDHRTDVFSLGAVLYELLTLEMPFPGETREQVIAGIVTRDPRRPRRINPRVPLDLETICLKALEKDPARRYATAGEMAQDLRRYLQGGLITARRAGPARRLAKLIRRRPVAATIVVSLMVLAGTAGLFNWRTAELRRSEAIERAVGNAKLHMAAGLYREGLDEVGKALQLDPEAPTARLVRARLLMNLGRTREAVQDAQALLERDAEDWTAHLILASAAESLPWIPAARHVEAVEQRAPKSADAYHLRALLAGSSPARLELLDQALDLDPGHAAALADRINLLVHDRKDHTAALLDCERLIAVRPRSAQGRRMKAFVFADRLEYDTALVEIERAIGLDPLDAVSFGARAGIERAMGRHEDAIADLGRAIALDPMNAAFYEDRAKAHNAAGRFEEATVDAQRSLEIDPDRRSAHLPLFHAWLRLGQTEELRSALDELGTAADGWADARARAWAHREIADRLRELRDLEAALLHAQRAIESDPGDFRGFFCRADIRRVLRDEGGFDQDCAAGAATEVREAWEFGDRGQDLGWICSRWDLALLDHDRGVAHFPNWYKPYFERATSYIFLGRHEEALADLTRTIELAPHWARPYANRSYVFDTLSRFEEELADLDLAIELDPLDAPDHHSNRGAAYVRFGRVEEALRDYGKAIELDPFGGQPYVNRGGLLAFLGHCDPALEDLRRVAGKNPTDPFLLQGLAWAHLNGLRRGCPDSYDPAAALRYAESAREGLPKGDDENFGHALYRNKRYKEARAALGKDLVNRKGEGATFLLAMCSWQLGDRAEARRQYTRASAWLDRYSPADPVLRWRQQEAAELLGIAR